MSKLQTLKTKVEELYASKNPNRDQWTDWLYDNHVLIVAKFAKELAEKYKANVELAVVAALLHDIADYKMERVNPNHETESLKLAKQIMQEVGYDEKDTKLVVDDAIRYHSCRDGEKPNSQEGLILATADALAHFKTDFYIHATQERTMNPSLPDLKKWVLEKIEKDLNTKISFVDEREFARHDYDILKDLYSR